MAILNVEKIISDLFDWKEDKIYWRWITAANALRCVGFDNPTRGEAYTAGRLIRQLNENTFRRSHGLSLFLVAPRFGEEKFIPAKIEKNIPIPVFRKKYNFSEMQIGDSVYFEGASMAPVNAAHAYGEYHNKKFVTKTEGTGRRVWRAE